MQVREQQALLQMKQKRKNETRRACCLILGGIQEEHACKQNECIRAVVFRAKEKERIVSIRRIVKCSW